MFSPRLFAFVGLLLPAGAAPAGRAGGRVAGPYNGSFIPGGLGLKKPLPAEEVTLKAGRPWSLYFRVKAEGAAPARTLLAGFGEPAGEGASRRYVALSSGRVSFWSGAGEVVTQARFAPGEWLFLAATFDGEEVTLYGGGVRLAAGEMRLADAAPAIHLAPASLPWADGSHFAGKIAGFTLLSRALSPAEVGELAARDERPDLTAFEPGSKTWPVQTKGQDGLRAPQEPASTRRARRAASASST